MADLGKTLGTTLGAVGGGIFGGPAGLLLGSGLGGLVGGMFSPEDNSTNELMKKALEQYQGIQLPDFKPISYEQYQTGGQYTPQQLSVLPQELQQAIMLKETPEMRQQQLAQLQAMQQLATTGMGPQEQLAMAQARQAANQDAQARQAAILNKFQQMGQAGSGGALQALLSGQQQTNQNQMMASMQAAAQAAENRRNAIAQTAQMAGGMRSQDLNVAQSNIEAQRQKQMFDTQNAMARQMTNAQMANQGNIMNLQRAWGQQDKNVGTANQELYRLGAVVPQQQYQNQLGLAGAKAGLYGQQAGLAQQQAQAGAQGWANVTSGLAGAGATMAMSDKMKNNPWSWS